MVTHGQGRNWEQSATRLGHPIVSGWNQVLKVWKDITFHIPKKLIAMENEMIEDGVRQGLFETPLAPYRKAHFWVAKKNGKYRLIISVMSVNWHTVEDAGIMAKVEEVSEVFTRLPMSSLIKYHSGYDKTYCTRIVGTIWPSRLRKRCIGWPDWYRELPIRYQHFSEYVRKYWTLSTAQLPKYWSMRSEWNAQRVGMDKTRWNRWLEFEGLL